MKEFKVGDKVINGRGAMGVVECIWEEDTYPIKVAFLQSGNRYSYTKEGIFSYGQRDTDSNITHADTEENQCLK